MVKRADDLVSNARGNDCLGHEEGLWEAPTSDWDLLLGRTHASFGRQTSFASSLPMRSRSLVDWSKMPSN